MKKLFLLLLIVSSAAHAQKRVYRSSNVVTVFDYRLGALKTFNLPVYQDTTAANIDIGEDSCGTLIFTRSGDKIWKRLCSIKRWLEVAGGGGGGSSDLETTLNNGSNLTINHEINSIGSFGIVARVNNIIRGDTMVELASVHNDGSLQTFRMDKDGFDMDVSSPSPFNSSSHLLYFYPAGAARAHFYLDDGDIYQEHIDSSSVSVNDIMWHDPATRKFKKGRFSETDPIYSASSWFSTTNNSSNWNNAFSWGDHSLAGYLNNTSGDARYPQLSATYNNPSWLNQLAWSKITGAPSVLVTGDLDTDGTLAANSDAKIATQKATKTYVDGKVNGYTLFFQSLSYSPGDGANNYLSNMPRTAGTTVDQFYVTCPKTGTLKFAEVFTFSGTVGTNEAWSWYVRVGGIDYLIQTQNLATGARVFTNTGLSIPVTAGNTIQIKSVNPTWATNPASVTVGANVYIE